MPVEFLTAEQCQHYGCYMGEPSPKQLELYFHLDDRDRALLGPRRHAHTRLGLALQLCTVRFLGTFLSDPTDVPHNVVLTLASPLNIADLTILSRYREGEMRHDHVHEIMAKYGYQDFTSQPEHFRFLRWLVTLPNDYPRLEPEFVRTCAQIDEFQMTARGALDPKCVRKCKLDGIACPQVQCLRARLLRPSAKLKRLIQLYKRLLAYGSMDVRTVLDVYCVLTVLTRQQRWSRFLPRLIVVTY